MIIWPADRNGFPERLFRLFEMPVLQMDENVRSTTERELAFGSTEYRGSIDWDRVIVELDGATERDADLEHRGFRLVLSGPSPAECVERKSRDIARLAQFRELRGESIWTVVHRVEAGEPPAVC